MRANARNGEWATQRMRRQGEKLGAPSAWLLPKPARADFEPWLRDGGLSDKTSAFDSHPSSKCRAQTDAAQNRRGRPKGEIASLARRVFRPWFCGSLAPPKVTPSHLVAVSAFGDRRRSLARLGRRPSPPT